MDDPNLPPRLIPGPPPSQTPPPKPKSGFQKVIASIGAVLVAIGKFILPALKLLKLGKILPTMLSMLLTCWLYAQLFGWNFAAGFVICVLVHELGHVFAAWRLGMAVSAPMFIPFMGALIMTKEMAKSAYEDALIGIAGPVFGGWAALACWGIYQATSNPLFLGLAYVGFFLNLFNLMPVFPLDGGRIVGAINPILWLVGVIAMVAMYIAGTIRNPMIIILVLLSLPRLWVGIKTRNVDEGYAVSTTTEQKWVMGIAYVGLSLGLFWAMGTTHETSLRLREFNEHRMELERRSQPAEPPAPDDDADAVRN